ncbi:hypothetical protein F7P69_11420 [Cellulosimicrobium funkei]|nr:hypothetical protein [Cellulosimicrobium funkei]
MNPDDARNDREKAADATNENSGHSIDGDTPPAEGLGVGPTNNELDVDRPGVGAKNKTWLAAILALVIIFVVLAIVGRIAGMF